MEMINNRKTLQFIAILALIVLLSFLCSKYFFQLMLIQGDSMEPYYHNLQLVVIDKTDREFCEGDVVAAWSDNLNALIVKRVVACGGDKVQIKDGILRVNGEPSALYATVYSPDDSFEYAGILQNEFVMGAGEFFLIGDNIKMSHDSRYEDVGVVPISDIKGKVMTIFKIMQEIP